MRISDWSSDVCSSDLSAPRSAACRRSERRGHYGIVRRFPDRDLCRDWTDLWRPRPVVSWLLQASGDHGCAAALSDRRVCITVVVRQGRSEEHTSELQSLMRTSYAVFCLKKKKNQTTFTSTQHISTHTHS